MASYHLSTEQKSILHWIEHGSGSAVIQAVAGSGKTSTLIECIRHAKKCADGNTPRILFVTFNRANCDHAMARLQGTAGVDVRTFNSVGFEICKRRERGVCLDPSKQKRLFRECVQHRINMVPVSHRAAERNLWLQAWPFIVHCLQWVRSQGILPANGTNCLVAHEWQSVHSSAGNMSILDDVVIKSAAETHGCLLPHVMRAAMASGSGGGVCTSLFQLVNDVLIASLQDRVNVDFDDQVYQPVVFRERTTDSYDWIFVDEAQDASPVQHTLVQLISSVNVTRVCAAGDAAQSLYAFRGAHKDSMHRMQHLFNAVELRLCTSFRCPEEVVALARCIVPQIRVTLGAQRGEAHRCHWTIDTLGQRMRAGDLVVAPHNTDLMKLVIACSNMPAYSLRWIAPTFFNNWIQSLERIFRDFRVPNSGWTDVQRPVTCFPGATDDCGIKCNVALGRIMHGLSLKQFIVAIKAAIPTEDDNCIDGDVVEDETIAMAKLLDRMPLDKDSISAWDGIKFVYAALAENTTNHLSNPSNAVTLATIHVAKGMEAARVFVINANKLSPETVSRGGSRAIVDVQSRHHALYVAITRAASSLTFVSICDAAVGECQCKTKHCPLPFIEPSSWPRVCH